LKIEAKTLEEAYQKAAKLLHCSVADIKADVIQYPSKGFLGFFAKPAVIEVEESLNIEKIIEKVQNELTELLKKSCYKVEIKKVSKYNDETIFIYLDGEDAALLIGKEGFRYNALNYMLYNYIHQKYGYKVRLEIAEFLKTQKEKLNEYIDFFIEDKIKKRGYGRTKPLRGILPFLAQEILRAKLPDKYIKIKEKDGEKYVVVGEKYGNDSGNSDS